MNPQPFVLEGTICQLILAKAFPFHFVVNNDGQIVGSGESIQRILPIDIDGSKNIFDHFTVKHPAKATTINELRDHTETFCLLKSVANTNLVLRGQIIFSQDAAHVFFLVSPWVTDLDILESLGLSLNEFPPHSPLSDFLILLQAQKTSLGESKRLSADLSVLNKELEDRVIRRTQALERNAQELRESKLNLEFEMNERARVEIELRHAQKLESVGQLAAGIAHEINTPMQYIGNSLQFIKSALADFDQVSEIAKELLNPTNTKRDEQRMEHEASIEEMDLDYIRDRAPKALDRALEGIAAVTRIVRAMNEFTHPDGEEKSKADINRALDTAATVAKNEYKYIAKLEKNFQPLPPVECHIGDLNQVFLNLIVNAAHAISDNGVKEGKIMIDTRAEKDVVRISISDNGGGIPDEITHRVFDPFFTTKEVGRGTGQGLTISHNIIVNKHGGQLIFAGNDFNGTTFQITLPITAGTFSDDPPPFQNNEDLAA
ncbi:MAG: sensor histidine kinase [Granulosicoccus sp.]